MLTLRAPGGGPGACGLWHGAGGITLALLAAASRTVQNWRTPTATGADFSGDLSHWCHKLPSRIDLAPGGIDVHLNAAFRIFLRE